MRAILIFALMLLQACDRDRPSAPDTDQQARLDEAEAMLNEMDDKEEGAAPAGTAPSNSN